MKKLVLSLIALGLVLKKLLAPKDGARQRPRSVKGEALALDATFREAERVELPVPHFLQENIFSWCYAACAQMILAAYGKPESQCSIVSSVKGPNCCANPNLPVCVDEGCDHKDIVPIYTSRGISAVRREPHGRISLEELRTELRGRRPVEVTLEADGGFHAVVVRGFNSNFLFINDPLEKPVPQIGFSLLTYEELVENEFYVWDETWTGFPRIP